MAIDTNAPRDNATNEPSGARGEARVDPAHEAVQMAQASGTPGAAPAAVTITAPPAGGRVDITVQPGARLVFQGVDLATAQIQQLEGGLLITLANGGVIFLAGFAVAAESGNPPVIEVAGIGTIDAAQLLGAASGANLDIAPAAGPATGVAHGGGASFTPFNAGSIGDGLPGGPLQPNEDFLRSPPEPDTLPVLLDEEAAAALPTLSIDDVTVQEPCDDEEGEQTQGPSIGGAIFITGHDSDEHDNGEYQSAGLDYLVFGHAAATGGEIAARANVKIVYLAVNDSDAAELLAEGWTDVTVITDPALFGDAFTGGYDVIMVGSGSTTAANTALLALQSNFTAFINAGGALFIHTDESFGQSWYDFVPNFGTTTNNTINTAGAFSVTAAGLGIGLTEDIVDADITHSFYTGINTSIFTVFEVTDPQFFSGGNANQPVAFGARGIGIGEGGFIPAAVAVFTVTLSAASAVDVLVDYITVDGTAIAGSDYVFTSGTLIIPAGSTTGTISVPILGDNIAETIEGFTVVLSSPVNAIIADGTGDGTILDCEENHNDVPVANADAASVAESGGAAVNYQLMFIIDVSSSMNNTELTTEIDAVRSLLGTYAAAALGGAAGVAVTLISFSGEAVTGLSLGTIAAANTALDFILANRPGDTGSGGTNYDAAVLNGAADLALWDSATSTLVNTVYFLTDGSPTRPVGSIGLSTAEEDTWEAALALKGATATAVGVGTGDATDPDLAAVAFPDDNVILVADFDALLAALVTEFGTGPVLSTVSGNVLTGVSDDGIAPNDSPADSSGADGFHGPNPIIEFVHDSATYTPLSAVGGTVLANDGTVIEITTALGGKFEFNFVTGAYTYTAPEVDADASELFTYTIEDGNGDQDIATLTINVNDVEPPTTDDVAASGDEDAASIPITLTGSDIDGTVTHFKLTSLPSDGTLYTNAGLTVLAATGVDLAATAESLTLFFVPTLDFNGEASFQYVAKDDDGAYDPSAATATITVTPVADPTVANDDIIITAINNDATFTVPQWALLANDTDPDGPLSISGIDPFDAFNFDSVTVSGANVSVNTDGEFDPGDSALFTYTATDGVSSDTAVVTVNAVASGTITGTGSDEIIVDNSSGHTVNAGGGNDIVFGNGGGDTLNGGEGNDILVVSDTNSDVDNFTAVNGGPGIDTFRFGDGVAARTLDLRGDNNELGNIDSIEIIDMTDDSGDDLLELDSVLLNALGSAGENSNITLTVADVLPGADAEFLDDEIDLFVLGDAGDDVDVPSSGSWINLGTATIDPAGNGHSASFTLYGFNVAGADDAVIAVQSGVTLV